MEKIGHKYFKLFGLNIFQKDLYERQNKPNSYIVIYKLIGIKIFEKGTGYAPLRSQIGKEML